MPQLTNAISPDKMSFHINNICINYVPNMNYEDHIFAAEDYYMDTLNQYSCVSILVPPNSGLS